MSPRFGVPGNLAASTLHGNGSISLNHAGHHPSGIQASEAASTPLHTEA